MKRSRATCYHLHRTLHLTILPTAILRRNSRDWKAKGSSPSLFRRGADTKARENVLSADGFVGLLRISVSPLSTDLTEATKFFAMLGRLRVQADVMDVGRSRCGLAEELEGIWEFGVCQSRPHMSWLMHLSGQVSTLHDKR